MNPTILSVRHAGSIASQRSYVATVQHDGEPAESLTFVGPTTGYGPVVMVTGAGQTFVTDPSRLGPFGPTWVRRFFGEG